MTRRARSLAAVTALAVLLVGCSDDDDAGPSTSTAPPNSSSPPTTEPGPSTTSPPSTPASTTTSGPTTTSATPTSSAPTTTAEPDLRPVLQRLLDRYDEAVAAILADPRVAADETNPAVASYLALFAPGSTFAQGALASWVEEGEAGRFYRPGRGGELVDSSVREVTPTTESEATFTACSVNSMEVVDASGNLIEAQGGVAFVTGVAIRVDDTWLLRDLSLSDGDCPRPGSGP